MRFALKSISFGLFFQLFWGRRAWEFQLGSQVKIRGKKKNSLAWMNRAVVSWPLVAGWHQRSCLLESRVLKQPRFAGERWLLLQISSSSRAHPDLGTRHGSSEGRALNHSALLQLLSWGSLNIKVKPKFETHFTLIREIEVINYSISSRTGRQFIGFPSKIIINKLQVKSLKYHLCKITFKHP